jgi:succinate dehydrogenase / fumarate reductase cytochrome b subunit
MASSTSSKSQKPLSPNIQLYRPQLTSVLSIVNRITGVFLSIAAIALVTWLLAAAAGPQAYAMVQAALASWTGQVTLFGCTFAFFLHFFGGIRHLVWDTVHGFDLRTIYMSGWAVVAASIVMTAVAWIASAYVGR